MTTALTNKAASDRSLSLLKLSFNFLRRFNTASPSPSAKNPNADASSSASKKPKRKKKKNLFEVAQFLPNWGIGYHMAKTHWNGVSYQITKINLYKVSLSFPFLFCIRQKKSSYSVISQQPNKGSKSIYKLFVFAAIPSWGLRVQGLCGLLQDGRHGKAWGIAHKEGECLVSLFLKFPNLFLLLVLDMVSLHLLLLLLYIAKDLFFVE